MSSKELVASSMQKQNHHTPTTYDQLLTTKFSQRGSVPIIAIVAGVVIVIAVLATLISLSMGSEPAPSPSPTAIIR